MQSGPYLGSNNKSRRVLIAEDMDDQREMIEALLANEAYEVVTAANGDTALMIYREARRRGEPFDLIVSDVRMPEMSGLSFSEAIRQDGDEVPILLMTAYDLDVIGDARYQMIHPCGLLPKTKDEGLAQLKPLIRDLLKQIDEGLTPVAIMN